MIFQNREEAAQLLAAKLIQYEYTNPLVLAIPRGAVPMAKKIADTLNGELDVVLVHKLGAPGQPELAIGALDESGEVYLNAYAEELATDAYLANEKANQLETLQKRGQYYRSLKSRISVKERIVIIVDDGIATGSTMAAALHVIRAQHPATLIAAAAVASPGAIELLEALADKVICLDIPEFFQAVGEFFIEFPQVTDKEVIELLKSNKP